MSFPTEYPGFSDRVFSDNATFSKSINQILSSVSDRVIKVLRPAGLAVVLLTGCADSANSERSIQETFDPTNPEHIEAGEDIQMRLRLETYGIPTYDMAEYLDRSNYEYYGNSLSRYELGSQVGMLLRMINESTGIMFGWLDIPVLADLVIAKHSGDQILWEETYSYFLSIYPALDTLPEVIARAGYAPGEQI